MKTKQFILATLTCTAGIAAAQNTITFAPHLKVGDVDRYKLHMTMTAPMAMTLDMTMSESVTKSYPNGDVDVTVNTSGGSMVMKGKPTQQMPATPPQFMRLNKFGQPVGGNAASMMGGMGMDPTSMASMLPHRPLHAGETFPIHQGKTGGPKIDGTMKVLSIGGGVAKLEMNTTMAMPSMGNMKMHMVTTMSTSDSKLRSLDGTISGMMGQQNGTSHITMTRL